MLNGDDETEDTGGLEADVRDELDTLARGTAVTPSSHRRRVTASDSPRQPPSKPR
jgi:hypothetical protein